MKIRDTPALCAVGDAVFAASVPQFDIFKSAMAFHPNTMKVALPGERSPAWPEPVPAVETWIFTRGMFDGGDGQFQTVWQRES